LCTRNELNIITGSSTMLTTNALLRMTALYSRRAMAMVLVMAFGRGSTIEDRRSRLDLPILDPRFSILVPPVAPRCEQRYRAGSDALARNDPPGRASASRRGCAADLRRRPAAVPGSSRDR